MSIVDPVALDKGLCLRSEQLIEKCDTIHSTLRAEKDHLVRIRSELERTYFRYQQLFNLAPVGFLTLDESGLIRDINHAGAVLFALDRRRPVTFLDLVTPEDHSAYERHVRKTLEEGSAAGCEVRLCSRDGNTFYGRLDSKISMDVRVSEVVHLMVVTDISERKCAERALEDAKELAEATVSSFSDAVITTDADALVTGLNAAAEALTGWSCADAKQKQLTDVFRLLDEEGGDFLDHPAMIESLTHLSGPAGERVYLTLISRTNDRRIIRGSASPICSRGGEVVGMVVTFADATESRRLMEEVVYDASHDALTGLINRREFEKRVERAIQCRGYSGGEHVLCFLDLDHFKLINDVAGHQAGDELLKHVAGAMTALVRGGDTVARLGGDEFAILLENCSLDKAAAVAEMIARGFQQRPFLWEGHRFEIGVSIGLAAITAQSRSWKQALGEADAACYAAKSNGRNRLHMNGAIADSARQGGDTLRADHLRDALAAGRFKFMCQPIFRLASALPHVSAYEVLLRLPDRRGGLHLPADFFPLAERYGLMCALDRWVLRTILRRGGGLIRGEQPSSLSVNISGHSLNDPSFLAFVEKELAESDFPRSRLWIEITESVAIHNLGDATAFMRAMRAQGSRIVLDDFGTGLSSFDYLRHFPVDLLKIDRSFVHNLTGDQFSRSVVAAIVRVAADCGIMTVGEGVETTAVLDILGELAIDYAQGFALGHPVPLEQVMECPRLSAGIVAQETAPASPSSSPAR